MSYGVQREIIQGCHKGEIRLSGSFRPNGSSAPTVWYGNWISSIAHTDTGVWTITMKEKFRGWQGAFAMLVSARFATLSLSIVQFGAVDLDAGTIVIDVATEGAGTLAAADIASNAANWIDIELVLKYDKSQDGSGLV